MRFLIVYKHLAKPKYLHPLQNKTPSHWFLLLISASLYLQRDRVFIFRPAPFHTKEHPVYLSSSYAESFLLYQDACGRGGRRSLVALLTTVNEILWSHWECCKKGKSAWVIFLKTNHLNINQLFYFCWNHSYVYWKQRRGFFCSAGNIFVKPYENKSCSILYFILRF